MSYLLKSSNLEDRRKNAQKRVLLTALVIVIVMIILGTGSARNSLFFIAEPIWKVEDAMLNSSFFEYFKFKSTLVAERQAMEQKLFMAGDMMAVNQTLQNENNVLKDLLGRKEVKTETVLAAILVKPPQTIYDLLILDVGEDYGVKVGDKVIANANVYIGEVTEVLPKSSKVTLYSTPGKKLPVMLGANSVSVEAVGMGGGNFNIFLPRELEVKEADVIVIPSITTNIFGIVEKVNFKETDSFQTVLFKSPVNISELGFVEVVL